VNKGYKAFCEACKQRPSKTVERDFIYGYFFYPGQEDYVKHSTVWPLPEIGVDGEVAEE